MLVKYTLKQHLLQCFGQVVAVVCFVVGFAAAHFWLYSGALPDSSELLMRIVASSSNYCTSVHNSSVCNVACKQNQGPLYPTKILNAWC